MIGLVSSPSLAFRPPFLPRKLTVQELEERRNAEKEQEVVRLLFGLRGIEIGDATMKIMALYCISVKLGPDLGPSSGLTEDS